MVDGIVDVAGDMLEGAVSVGGKIGFFLVMIAIAFVVTMVVISHKQSEECAKKGGTIMEINGSSTCVAKDSLKKL